MEICFEEKRIDFYCRDPDSGGGFSGLVFRLRGNVPIIRSVLPLTEKNSEPIRFPRTRSSTSETPMSAKSKMEKLQ